MAQWMRLIHLLRTRSISAQQIGPWARYGKILDAVKAAQKRPAVVVTLRSMTLGSA